eukprot:700148_1
MDEPSDYLVLQNIKIKLEEYVEKNKDILIPHVIGTVEKRGKNKKMKSGKRGGASRFARVCAPVITESLKESKCRKKAFTWCVCGKILNCTCGWVKRYKQKLFEIDFADCVFHMRHSGFNAKVSTQQQRQIQLDDIMGLFRDENEIQFMVCGMDGVQLAKFTLLCRSFQVILTDITPGGNGMRVSYDSEPKILIQCNGFDGMMVIGKATRRDEPPNRKYVCGVGYSSHLSPVICLHREFMLDNIIQFWVPEHASSIPIQLWLKVNGGAPYNLSLLSMNTSDTSDRSPSMETTSSLGVPDQSLSPSNANHRTNEGTMYDHINKTHSLSSPQAYTNDAAMCDGGVIRSFGCHFIKQNMRSMPYIIALPPTMRMPRVPSTDGARMDA